jgi:autotransporter-associated beta strand protein
MKKTPYSTSLGRILAAVSGSLVLVSGITQIHAADRTWNGGGDQTSWTDAANWGGTAPVANDSLFFGGSTGLSQNNDLSTLAFAGLTFNSDAGSFTMAGTQVNLAGGVTNNSANLQSITLTLSLNGANRDLVAAAGDLSCDRVNGSSSTKIVKSGPGTLMLGGTLDNSFGSAIINDGVVVLAKPSTGSVHAFGADSTVNTNGTLRIAGTGADQIHSGASIIMDGGVLQMQMPNLEEEISMLRGANPLSIVENGLTDTTNKLRVGGGRNKKAIYGGMMRNGAAGVLDFEIRLANNNQVLNGTNTYTGVTIISGNDGSGTAAPTRLIVNGVHTGGGAYSIVGRNAVATRPGVLAGSGVISASVMDFNDNATLSPGGSLSADTNTATYSDTTAILTISNTVNLNFASSALEVQLNGTSAGTGYDQVNIAGAGSFSNNSANLKLALGFTPATGDKFTLVKVQGTNSANTSGTFASLNGVITDLSQGAVFVEPVTGKRFQISYRAEGSTFDMGSANGNDIMLLALADAAGPVTWRGNGGDNIWDFDTTANWVDTNNVVVTFTNNPVVFDDSGASNLLVNLTAAVQPPSILFNSTSNYVIGGSGDISGTVVVTKTNSGTVAIVNENGALTGTTVIRTGVFQIGTNGTSGSWSGAININSNGVLAVNRSDDVVFGNSVVGSGSAGILHNGSGAMIVNTTIPFTGKTTNTGGTLQLGDGTGTLGSLAGDINIGSGKQVRYLYNGNVTIANTFSGNGTVLWDNPDGNFRTYAIPTTAVSSNFTGTNVLASGIRVQALNDNLGYLLGNASVVIVTNGAQIYLDRSGVAYNQQLFLSGDGWSGEAVGFGYGALRIFQNTISGPITLGSDVRIGGSSLGGTISGRISGGANQLEIYGDNILGFPFVLSLSNPTNSWGNTLVTWGSLRATAPGAISTNGMTIDLNGQLHVFGNTVSVNNLQNGPNGGGLVYNMSGSTAGTLVVGADGTSTGFDGTFGDGSSRALNLTKVGAGTLTLSATSTNTGTVTVNGGTLALTGAGSFANASGLIANATLDVSGIGGTLNLSSGQTLGGSGNVAGEVVAPAGSTVAPGASVGTLTVSGNVSLGGQLQMELNRTNAPFNCDRLVSSGGTITYGGTLLITNIGPTLQVNDTFQIFPSGVPAYTGNTTLATTDASGATYTWQNDIASLGSVKVLSVTGLVNTTPTNIVASVSGGNLNLSWPSDHTGWSLQTQTNVLGVGLSTNWVTVPGSTATNAVSIPISPANPAVFFRLQYP